MMTYEPKTDPNTGVKYVELTENDGCIFIDNLPNFKDEAEEKAYYAGLEKVGYVDLETAAEIAAAEAAAAAEAEAAAAAEAE